MGHLEAILGYLEAILEAIGQKTGRRVSRPLPLWLEKSSLEALLGRSWGALEGLGGRLGALLDVSGASLGRFWGTI